VFEVVAPISLINRRFIMQDIHDKATESWQEVHRILTNRDWISASLPELLGSSTYAFCFYKIFGQKQDALLACHLFERVALRPEWYSIKVWPAEQLDYACMAAWLNARLVVEGLQVDHVLLAEVDQALGEVAEHVIQHPDTFNRSRFFRILRYFSLRLPGQQAAHFLQRLLVWFSAAKGDLHKVPVTQTQVSLGLDAGLAAELLVLIRLHALGLQNEGLKNLIVKGIIGILALKRNVDFQDGRFAVFPYQVHSQTEETTFSPTLSWRRGDIGQSLLLYQAHAHLQEPELAKIAELVGLNTLLRTTIKDTGIVSSQLYDGAAGVAHLYARLYRLSGQDKYQKGQRYWLGQTQSWLRQELLTGYYQQRENEVKQGLVGVALVMLSTMTDLDLDWEAALL
jgi:hypothetical protein